MTASGFIAMLPILILAAGALALMLLIAWRRHHGASSSVTVVIYALAALALPVAAGKAPQQIGELLVVDQMTHVYTALMILAGAVVAVLNRPYIQDRNHRPEEFYLLLLLGTTGAATLTAATHFASIFLSLELLTISLYGMIGYARTKSRSLEAAMKYLVLAAVSSAFLLFGMALVYTESGELTIQVFAREGESTSLLFQTGLAMITAGVGFKLAVVPFHLWTPDVYQGAPVPATAFVATASKGAVVGLLLRIFTAEAALIPTAFFYMIGAVAAASMLAGNLLALRQTNVKRLLAYSSIAHLGYILVAFLAAGALSAVAVTFYLTAYIITILAAFSVIAVLSTKQREAENQEDFQGLAWERPWLALLFTLSLLSLAGIPLTAGFVAKFFVAAAGADGSLWMLLGVLVISSVIGFFYYLRLIIILFASPEKETGTALPAARIALSVQTVLTILLVALLLLGTYPAPLLNLLQLAFGVT